MIGELNGYYHYNDKTGIVCDDDGNIVEEFPVGGRLTVVFAGDKINRKNSLEFLQKREQYKRQSFDGEKFDMYKTYDFLKLNAENVSNLKCNENEAYLLLKLAPFVPYNGSAVGYGNGKPLDKEQIVKILGWSISKFEHVVLDMSKKQMIKSVKNKTTKKNEYYLNPFLVMRGAQIDKNVRKLFDVDENGDGS